LGNDGFPPLHIHAGLVSDAPEVTVKGNVSSQFLTGLLMSAPLLGRSVTIKVDGELISKPYIKITLGLMAKFGVKVEQHGWEKFTVPVGRYQSPGEIEVEGDASSASYFLAAGALGHGPVRVQGVGRNALQGDVQFAAALARMGAEIGMGPNWIEAQLPCSERIRAVDMDCNHIPDAAMTLAVLALFADGPSTLRNIGSWRVKETDRIAAMATELRKFGAEVEEGADYLKISPPKKVKEGVAVDTYDDHRMAMCFSLVTLGGVPVRINDPKCVNKTFPEYFNALATITGQLAACKLLR
jgi:3-phosphoshikimate 1-carboxyvinyltransferase